MNKQDLNGVRTAQDLERKYDFNSMKKNTETNIKTITKVQNELTEFAKIINNGVDGSVTTWFMAGVPTLDNEPAISWTDYSIHVNDLYYDSETGYAYRFVVIDGVYSWERQVDKDILAALALANSAKDTADGKRRVFTLQPTTPYDSGDLWINEGDIYICQTSREEGDFVSTDFIIATKYTDDTYAVQVDNKLEVIRGTVTKIIEDNDSFQVQFDTTVKTINSALKENQESIETMKYNFNTDDLTIAKSTDPINTHINNQGMKVYNYNTMKAIFNQNGTGIQKLIVVGDSQLAHLKFVKAVDENQEACTDIHHLVSNIQDLHDLE